MEVASEMVTLVVSDWSEVAPGTLAVVCPDLPSAQRVARAMRNALRWFVVPGEVTPDEALSAHARGDVLLSESRATRVPPAFAP